MKKNKIGFIGEGWGAVVAVKSIQEYFTVQCCSKDQKILDLLRPFDKIIDSFDEFSCDTILCAGYKSIIPQNVLERFKIINIHYSLLPAYRGLHSTAWAIYNDEKYLGLTFHLVNEKIDDGDIIHQKKFKNDKTSSATFYMELMNKYILKNCGKLILNYIDGKIKVIKQDKKRASWVGKRSEVHNFINFNDSFEGCNRLLRILQPPYPYPSIRYKGKIYYVRKVTFYHSNVITDISRILNIDDDGIWVKSREGYIILNSITCSNGTSIDKTFFKIGSYLND